MKTILYSISILTLLLALSIPVNAQKEVLFLSENESGLDSALMEYLYYEGEYNVTYVSPDDFGSDYSTADDYVDYDVLFVSESIGSSDANNYGTAGFPIPCVLTEGFTLKQGRLGILADDSETFFKQAGSGELTADALQIVIENNEHWITQDFELDDELQWAETETPTALGVTSFDLSADIDKATSLASFKQDMGELSAVWAVDSGAILHAETDSIELPNMVFIGIIQTEAGQVFTIDFMDFIVRCLQWVTNDYVIESGINDVVADYGVTVNPNPVADIMNISLTVPTSGNATVNIYDITGKLVQSDINNYLSAGKNTLHVNCAGLNASQYIYQIITETGVINGRMIKE